MGRRVEPHRHRMPHPLHSGDMLPIYEIPPQELVYPARQHHKHHARRRRLIDGRSSCHVRRCREANEHIRNQKHPCHRKPSITGKHTGKQTAECQRDPDIQAFRHAQRRRHAEHDPGDRAASFPSPARQQHDDHRRQHSARRQIVPFKRHQCHQRGRAEQYDPRLLRHGHGAALAALCHEPEGSAEEIGKAPCRKAFRHRQQHRQPRPCAVHEQPAHER